MMQAYLREGMTANAVFTLFVRRLPPRRNYLLACGLDDVLSYLENVRFSDHDLQYLASLPQFDDSFIEHLRGFRFTGDVHAVPEGTPVFPDEPILEVVAALPEAQLVETMILNQMHLQTMLASKAARVVAAAQGRPVLDFGLRRMHGKHAGLKAARAFRIAGVDATSNVLAGSEYAIPISGTMAHSYIQAHDSELDAFREFAALYPDATLLVDTYGTMAGVENVIRLARELGEAFRVRAIRLDSGDLGALARAARSRLDESGLRQVRIVASGGLDEFAIRDLLDRGAPIDGFGVGTAMGVSKDEPSLDMVYKLTEYGGRGRVKTSPGKQVLPGRKQVFRIERDGVAAEDVITRHDEESAGRALLHPVMRDGNRMEKSVVSERERAIAVLEDARERAARETALLPQSLRGLDPPNHPYAVRVSGSLGRHHQAAIAAAEAS
ncbi:MAG: nicotinate phosphoribosyltransferase [Gemmatimonadetes bacterium]|nr:nicotinate phosphoribosyltransferase [Gemmatimonadota bacterium]